MKFAPGTSQEQINEGLSNWNAQISGNKPTLNLGERDTKRTEFVNNFKSKFGGGMRKAGDYLSAFAQDPKNSSFLSGSKDLRNGIKNSQDSNEPSAVMKTMGATATPAPGTKVSKAKATTPASLASPDDAYDFRAWAEATHKDKGGSQSVDYWEKAYRKNAAEAAKTKQAIDSYTGPITGEEWAALDQQNFDNNPGIDAYTNKLKSSYAEFSGYHTNVQNNKQWEAASAKWKK